MSRDPRDELSRAITRVEHMLVAAEAIKKFVDGISSDEFRDDLKTIYAVRAGFITLGEASGEVPDAFREEHAEVPWRDIRQFRNFMVHVYFEVSPERLYETAISEIPPLVNVLRKLLIKLKDRPRQT